MKRLFICTICLLLAVSMTGCAEISGLLSPNAGRNEKQVSSGALPGILIEEKNVLGTVVGAIYAAEQDEIRVAIEGIGDQLAVRLMLANPGKVPYCELDTIGIAKYSVLDVDGKTVFEGQASTPVSISENMESLKLDCGQLDPGSYRLAIKELTGNKKADAPLNISGIWEYWFEIK